MSGNDFSLLYALSAYILWGLLPVYWKILKTVPAYEILANRVLWSGMFLLILLALMRKFRPLVQLFKSPKKLLFVSICGILISLNWFTYIKAVNGNDIIATSMGYYINPLLSVLLGVIVLKEKLSRSEKISIFFAAAGIAYTAFSYGKVPLTSLILAFTFSLYGLIKKINGIDSVISLAGETLVVSPVFVIYYHFLFQSGDAVVFHDMKTFFLLAGSGAVTAFPLFLFGKGVKGLKLSTTGLLQYIAPSIALLLGVFVYGEKFHLTEIISFSLIWTGLVIYSVSSLYRFRTLD